MKNDVSDAHDVRFEALPRDQLTPRLLERVLGLYSRAFPRWPYLDPGVSAADYLRWKTESPGCPFAITVGWLEDRLVVARLAVLYRIRVQGRSLRMLDTPDLAVDPDHQGRGISTACTAFNDRVVHPHSDLEIDESTNQRVWKSRLRADAAPIANVIRSLYLAPDPRRVTAETLGAGASPRAVLLFALRAAVATTRWRASLRRPPRLAGRIRTLTSFYERVDAFFERAAAPFDLIYQLDRERLEWRYCDRRAGPFVIRVLEERGEMLGLAVHRRAGVRGFLADLLVVPGRDDVTEALARDAAVELTTDGAAAVSCWLPDRHPYRNALRRAGFLTLPRPVPLRYRTQSIPPGSLAFLDRADARLHFTLGSTDLV